MSEKKYYYLDFGEPIVNGCYLRMRSERSAIHFLSHEVKIINGYAKFIDQYPQIKCEPLEFLYQCLRSVSMMSPKLLDDQIDFGWRGALWSSWVALITPHDNSYFIPALEKINGVYPHNDWIVKLALAHCKKTNPQHEIIQLAEQFRAFLKTMPKLDIPLRKWPSPMQLKLYELRCYILKRTYRLLGTDAALKFMQKSKQEWELSHNEWHKKTRK